MKALDLDECGGSSLVDTSLMSIFLDDTEQRYHEYFKTDFYFIWIGIFLLWQTLYVEKGLLKVWKTIFYEMIAMGII